MSSDPRRRPAPVPPPPPPPPPDTMPDSTKMGVDGTSEGPQNGGTANGQQQGDGFKLKFCTVCASNNNRSMEAHLRLSSASYPTLSFGTGSLVRLPGPSITQPNVYNFNAVSYAQMHDELAAKDPRLYRANGILPMLERNRGVKWGPERWQDWKIGVPRVGRRPEGAVQPPQQQQQPQNGTGPAAQPTTTTEEPTYLTDKGHEGTEAGTVDVVITCEERCWDAVLEDLLARGSPLNRPVHVFNVDIKDNHEEALVGGKAILDLADALNAAAREERDVWLGRGGGGAGPGFDGAAADARRGFDERVPDVLGEWQGRWPALPALWSLCWF
ncbi:RNA polymerase II subunit A C-terminal domain phosphatase [Elasticomyces elasticus]|nr:RNA polymerase II subunit A C-terminal domain phosphatase [Elasticomyces elasticus]